MIAKQHIIDRFVRYVTVDTESDPNSQTTPSSKKQWDLAHALAQEFMDAARGAGWATSQRDEMHRIAEANRAYVRYQWWK